MAFGLNNPKLRQKDEPYSEKDMEEIAHCAADIFYFANFFKIINEESLVVDIPLRDYQVHELVAFCNPPKDNPKKKDIILVSSRQSGKCVTGDTHVTIRDRKSGEIYKIRSKDFYNYLECRKKNPDIDIKIFIKE
jgi:hypothetical protein